MTASAVAWVELTHDGVRLACRDYGGFGPPALLLHGLTGHAGEWSHTASWLTNRCRVLALDTRGHGFSERDPEDVSRAANVADAAAIIEQVEQRPVILIGHSLGGITALMLAASRPELVRALILADTSPVGDAETANVVSDHLGESLRQWPVPFATREAGLAYFVGQFGVSPAADAAADGLEKREDGWWPRFDIDVMVRTLSEAISTERWEEWQQISCPTLIVRAGNGLVEPQAAQKMLALQPTARLVEIPNAAHDVHLDKPDAWRDAITEFLDELCLAPPRSPVHMV